MTGQRTAPTAPDGPLRVLFLCVHNSARSLMAEALLRQLGGDAFEAHSAGTEAGGVNPLTLRALAEAGVPADGLSSKPVAPFVGQRFDFVVTVCDPAREACPYFPGARRTLHWSFDDPQAAEGTDEQRMAVFRRVLREIRAQVEPFVPAALAERGTAPVAPG